MYHLKEFKEINFSYGVHRFRVTYSSTIFLEEFGNLPTEVKLVVVEKTLLRKKEKKKESTGCLGYWDDWEKWETIERRREGRKWFLHAGQ